jgi:hypothetical protein
MFRDREDAGLQVARMLRNQPLRAPLVLGIPRGGVVVGAVIARELGADLDVILARKLRAPAQAELAIGAIGEDGNVYLNKLGKEIAAGSSEYLASERASQRGEIDRLRQKYRQARPPAPVAGRSVIVTDDGIATGATMIAALHVLSGQHPDQLIVAVPVASPERLREVQRHCDQIFCVRAPVDFWAIGQYYRSFPQIDDETVVRILREFVPQSGPGTVR